MAEQSGDTAAKPRRRSASSQPAPAAVEAKPKRAAAKPAAVKPQPEKAKAEPAKRAPKAKPAAPAAPALSAEERNRMIAEAAYFRAQRRGFQAGYEQQDWLEAEAEIDARK